MKHGAQSFLIKVISTALILAGLLASTFTFAQNNPLLINTTEGPVEGFKSKLNTYSWHGIPFAQAPLGELRWRAPQTPLKRELTLKATDNSHMCVQKGGLLSTMNPFKWNKAVGSEDCLYLNITAPADITEGEKLPVMFWIHGGGNSVGYKGNRAYTGEHLSANGRVVVISVNYRLGPLGWFHHPALHSPNASPEDRSGNYGTLDLIQALSWVQDNIENFGGDPNRVTIFGESAGGTNVYSLLISPLAKGLFHRAISQSGGMWSSTPTYASAAHDQGGHPSSSHEISKRVLPKANASAEELAQALRTYDAEDLVELYKHEAVGMLDFPRMVTDGYVLPSEDLSVVFSDTSRFNAVPVMLGTNRDEVKSFMALDPRFVDIGFRMKDQDMYDRWSRYLSNNWKVRGVDSHARVIADSYAEVYAYRFDWDELPKIGFVDLSTLMGAGHGLEIPFVFGELKSDFRIDLVFSLDVRSDSKENRKAFSDTIQSYWTEFAYTGSPGKGRNGNLPQWQPWNNQGQKFLVLDTGEGGIRMSDKDLSREYLKQQLLSDSIITELETRCLLFQEMFIRNDKDTFNMEEYWNFGKEQFGQGCETVALKD